MKYPLCRGGFVKFHPPPRERIYDNEAKQFMEQRGSWIFKHPPPSKNTWFYKTKKYAKDTYDNSAVTRQRIGFISQTDPQIGIRQKTDALVSAKRNEAGRACS